MATRCVSCDAKMPLVIMVPWTKVESGILCPRCAKSRGAEHDAAAAAAAAKLQVHIRVLTGDHPKPYEVIDSVFAIDSATEALFQGLDPGAAFDGVKQQLRVNCSELGGDAVINCSFEYRNVLAGGALGKKQGLEIFAYGTAIRLVKS